MPYIQQTLYLWFLLAGSSDYGKYKVQVPTLLTPFITDQTSACSIGSAADEPQPRHVCGFFHVHRFHFGGPLQLLPLVAADIEAIHEGRRSVLCACCTFLAQLLPAHAFAATKHFLTKHGHILPAREVGWSVLLLGHFGLVARRRTENSLCMAQWVFAPESYLELTKSVGARMREFAQLASRALSCAASETPICVSLLSVSIQHDCALTYSLMPTHSTVFI